VVENSNSLALHVVCNAKEGARTIASSGSHSPHIGHGACRHKQLCFKPLPPAASMEVQRAAFFIEKIEFGHTVGRVSDRGLHAHNCRREHLVVRTTKHCWLDDCAG
jgi:hypothetical protein